jgi:hypothetical protein
MHITITHAPRPKVPLPFPQSLERSGYKVLAAIGAPEEIRPSQAPDIHLPSTLIFSRTRSPNVFWRLEVDDIGCPRYELEELMHSVEER